MYDDIIKARESLEKLIEITKTNNMVDIGDYIDNLDENTCKHMLKMIAYGSYKDFIRE